MLRAMVCSTGHRSRLCAWLTYFSHGEVSVRPSPGGNGDDVVGTLVALVGQDGDAELDEGGDGQVSAGCGQVVRVTGQRGRDPRRCAVRGCDNLQIHSMTTVFAREAAAAAVHPVALGEGAVQQNVAGVGRPKRYGQTRCLPGGERDDTMDIGVGDADADTETGRDLGKGVVLAQPAPPSSVSGSCESPGLGVAGGDLHVDAEGGGESPPGIQASGRYGCTAATVTTFGTKVIVVTRREAHYVLDEIMGNKTDLPVTEHATDTHGVTLVNFALFDLVGMQLSPRIRDLGKITLYRMDPQRDVNSLWPVAGPLLTQKINMGLIEENWDDLLRLAGSIKFGHATASLIVGKLSTSSRQNTLAAAQKEYGALRRTVYVARYLADETYRRKIARQLNKGESLHSLRRSLLYAHEGVIRHRHLAAQTEQAWCLTLLTNSVVTWTTEYYGLAIAQMRAEGRAVEDELLAHISPAHSENVNFFGTIAVEVDTELAKLDPAGYRPLRSRRPDRPGSLM